LIAKIEWIHDSIPIEDLYLHKKITVEELEKSTMSNLYMLEQQLWIIKKQSKVRNESNRANRLAHNPG
jgi:hypothetical protein